MPKIIRKYQLRIPSQSDNLVIIRDVVSKVAKKVGFNNDDVSKIELAVDEACTNVIKHAYGQNSNKFIEVVIQIDNQKFMVIVSDKGKGFNPEDFKLPKMDDYLTEMRIGGLGIYLIETLMDKVVFNIKPGFKNQVKMIKYFVKEKINTGKISNINTKNQKE
ncbi:MAG: ATP-binding protein [bacterium]